MPVCDNETATTILLGGADKQATITNMISFFDICKGHNTAMSTLVTRTNHYCLLEYLKEKDIGNLLKAFPKKIFLSYPQSRTRSKNKNINGIISSFFSKKEQILMSYLKKFFSGFKICYNKDNN